MAKELLSKTATQVAKLIETKEVSPVEVTRALLDHAHELNDTVNAYISFRDDTALQEAQKAEDEIAAGQYKGPLHGIPMAIKDNIYIGGEVTTMASKIHRDFVSKDDSSVVKKLKEAGAVLTGKLNMHEYAWGSTITTRILVRCITPGTSIKFRVVQAADRVLQSRRIRRSPR